jgi:hypothetical protein
VEGNISKEPERAQRERERERKGSKKGEDSRQKTKEKLIQTHGYEQVGGF